MTDPGLDLGLPFGPERDIDRRAREFHEANPHVMRELREIARDLRRRGVRRFGIAALFERLRWIAMTRTAGDKYRLNNSFRAWYARQLMAQDASLADLFTTRTTAHDPEYHDRAS